MKSRSYTNARVPLGPGDARPGRVPQLPSALVIDPAAANRTRVAAELTAAGYQVWTCPGPCTSTRCPARDGARAERCPRLPADVRLIVVDQASARTELLGSYASWVPAAQVEITGTLEHEVPIRRERLMDRRSKCRDREDT